MELLVIEDKENTYSQCRILHEKVREMYPTKDLQVVHIGGNSKFVFNSEYKDKWNYNYYKRVKSCGDRFRPDGMTDISGVAYKSLINEQLHNGNKKYNLQYELGFIYVGMPLLIYCDWVHCIALESRVTKVVFCCLGGELLNSIFKILYNDISSDLISWQNEFWEAKNTIVHKGEIGYCPSILKTDGNMLIVGDFLNKYATASCIEFMKSTVCNEIEYFDFVLLLHSHKKLSKSAEMLKNLYAKYFVNIKKCENYKFFADIKELILSTFSHKISKCKVAANEGNICELSTIDIDNSIVSREIQQGILDFVRKFQSRYSSYYELMDFSANDIISIAEFFLGKRKHAKRYLQMISEVENIRFKD